MDVHIRGHFYISQEYKVEHGFSWSAMIDPKDPGGFFDSYTGLLLDWIPILNKYHVKLLTPFTEMDGIEKDTQLLKTMYATLDEAFDGKLGFEESTNAMLQGRSPIEEDWKTFEQVVPNFTFWNWEDSQGRPMRIEYSGWSPDVETQKDQRVSVMSPNFVSFWNPAVDYYRSTYLDNPQMFGEIGAYNADGQSLGANLYYEITPSQRVYDEQERADFILAALKGAKALGIMAINVWGGFQIDNQPWLGMVNIVTGHYSYPESPMYRTITAIIKPEE